LTWRCLNSNTGQFHFIFLLSLSHLENHIYLSCNVQMAGDCMVRFLSPVFVRRPSVPSQAFAPRGAGTWRRVSVSVSKALFCFYCHGSHAVRVRDSAPASVISGCDFSFPRTGFVSRWSFRSQARHARSSINKAEVFIFFSAPLALVSVSVSAGLHC
jgi:hypothetical protein